LAKRGEIKIKFGLNLIFFSILKRLHLNVATRVVGGIADSATVGHTVSGVLAGLGARRAALAQVALVAASSDAIAV